MPDAPISTTRNLALGQWAEAANPGAEALNENWEKVDAGMIMQGAANPSEYAIGGMFLNTTARSIVRNDGTEEAPVWVTILDLGGLENTALLKDGSVPMTGDLNLGGNKIESLGNGTEDDDAVTVQQLEAAVDGALGSLSGSYAYVLARNTGDLTDTSPVLFEADENDGTTSEPDLHDEVTNNSEFVATQDGFYMLVARMRVANGGGGSVKWLINGIEAPACVYPMILHDVGENEVFLQDVMMVGLDAGDVVTLGVYGLETEPLTIKEDSTVAMFLLAANAVGGGDLKADGTIPMAGDLDMAGFKIENLGDGVAADDAVNLGQMQAADEALQDQIDDINAPPVFKAPEVEVVTGTFAFGTSWVECPTSRLDFTLTAERRVVMDAQGTSLPDFLGKSDAQIGIRLQQMVGGNPSGSPEDFVGTYYVTPNLGGSHRATLVCTKRKTIAAGDWRVSVIGRRQGTANSAGIEMTAANPLRIGLTYMEVS